MMGLSHSAASLSKQLQQAGDLFLLINRLRSGVFIHQFSITLAKYLRA
jgi:hypothetical protein